MLIRFDFVRYDASIENIDTRLSRLIKKVVKSRNRNAKEQKETAKRKAATAKV